jgi:hypothetical protein
MSTSWAAAPIEFVQTLRWVAAPAHWNDGPRPAPSAGPFRPAPTQSKLGNKSQRRETIFPDREVVPQQIGPSFDGVEQRGSIIVI